MTDERLNVIANELDNLTEDERLFALYTLLPCYKDLIKEFRENTLKAVPDTVADVMAEYMMAEHERVVDQMSECLMREIF